MAKLIDRDKVIEEYCKDCGFIETGLCNSKRERCESMKLLMKQSTTTEAEIRNKAIEEFAERCKQDILCQTFGLHPRNIDAIAEQMKGEANETD